MSGTSYLKSELDNAHFTLSHSVKLSIIVTPTEVDCSEGAEWFGLRRAFLAENEIMFRPDPARLEPGLEGWVWTEFTWRGGALIVLIAQYPFVQDWLTAKVVLLVIYIGLGTIALRRGKTKAIRVGTWVAAILVFATIVLIAIHKTPIPLSPS